MCQVAVVMKSVPIWLAATWRFLVTPELGILKVVGNLGAIGISGMLGFGISRGLAEDEVRFGSTTVWSIQLEMSPTEFDAMQPPLPAGFGTPPPAANERESVRSLFGTEFRWAKGTVVIEGERRENVGIRYAGDMTYLVSASGLKRPIMLDFARFSEQDLGGRKALQLHAMPLDPDQARETLGYSVFRDCDVPVPRTAYAEVTLSVPGRLNQEVLGLYTVVEELDARFLDEHFASSKGLAMKPFGIRGVDHYEALSRREQAVRPLAGDPEDREAVSRTDS